MSAFKIDTEAVREILIEEDALRFEREGDNLAPILGDNEIARYWPEVQPDVANQCVAYLEQFASIKNNKKIRYVDDPLVSGEVKPGRWRQVRVYVEMIGEVARIVQILRRGWRTSLMINGVLDFSESRIIRSRELEGNSSAVSGVNNTTSDNEERYLLVRFPNISNQHVRAIMTELAGVGIVTDLTVNGENYGSSLRKIFAVCNMEDSDGSMVIDVLFAESQFTINSYNSWGGPSGIFGGEVSYLWGVPKELAQQIIDDYRAIGAGRGASCGYSSEQGTVDIILNAKRRDGSGNLVKIPFSDGLTTMQQCSADTVSYFFFDVEDPESGDYDIGTGTSFPPTTGVTYRKTIRSNNDDTWDIVIDVITEIERKGALNGLIVSRNYFTKVTRTIDLGTDDAVLDAPEVGINAGQVTQKSVSVKENCLKDVITEVEAPVASREWSYDFKSDYGTVYVYIGRNVSSTGYSAAVSAASLSDADTNSIEKVYNQFGLIDYKIVKNVNYGSGDLWQNGETDWIVEDDKGKWWKISRKWCGTMGIANTFLDATSSSVPAEDGHPALSFSRKSSGGGHTTTVSPASRGRCIATRVELGTEI